MHRFYYTYKITLLKGSLAGHYYYGQHRTDDLNDGYAGSGIKVNKYYNKYGKIEHQTYIKEIIAFYSNDDELNEAEYKLIGNKFETDKLCLNLMGGGLFHKLSENSKKKISNTLKGHIAWNKGIFTSNETKEKLSKAHKGLHHSEETRKRISEHNYTKLNGHSEEIRKKISEAKKGKKLSEEHIQNLRGKKRSEESKEKMRQAKLGKHWIVDPETNKRKYI